MKPLRDMWREDPELALELLEERAAIIEEGEGCTRYLAQNIAAQQAGFANWVEAGMKIRRELNAKSQRGAK